MAKISRTAGNYRDFTFTPSHYGPPKTSGGVVTYTAKKETGIGIGHPPGPETETRDEFLYIQNGDTVSIRAKSSPATANSSGTTDGDIEIDIAGSA